MEQHTQIVRNFYEAFARRDHRAMQSQYSDHIQFFDPVFGHLEGEQVRRMWQILCERARDFSLEIGEIRALDDEYVTCVWTARYTYSMTGKPVVNKVKAHMRIQNGLITEHSDAFSFHRWAAQVFGMKGYWLGWTGFFRRKLQAKARAMVM